MEVVPQIKTYRLSEITGSIERTIANAFAKRAFWVIADITDYKYYAQKDYHYFTLVEKDEDKGSIKAKVQGVAWSAGSAKIKRFQQLTGQKFQNGIHVLVRVTVDYHSVYGLKLNVVDINNEFTLGKLEQQRQETLLRLQEECGGFIKKIGDTYKTANNCLPLNVVIQKIAVVTSNSSAGYEDFRHELDKNPFGYKFDITTFFTAVQGTLNAEAMCEKLDFICKSMVQYDAVVIMRGGGNETDFLIFDQYELCKQVAQFPFPVITGIGHQRNETIVDLMAHSPVKTPTKAAQFIISHNRKYEESLLEARNVILIKTQSLLARRLQLLTTSKTAIVSETRQIIDFHKSELVRFNQTLVNTTKRVLYNRKATLLSLSGMVVNRPQIMVAAKANDLKNLMGNIKAFTGKYLTNKGYVRHYVTVVRMMSPINILRKGFAIVYLNDKIVTSGDIVPLNRDIRVRFSDTEILSTTKTKTKVNGDELNV